MNYRFRQKPWELSVDRKDAHEVDDNEDDKSVSETKSEERRACSASSEATRTNVQGSKNRRQWEVGMSSYARMLTFAENHTKNIW